LLDALCAQEAGVTKNLQMFTGGWLTHLQLFSDKYSTNTIFDQVAIDLRRKMLSGMLQPFQNLKPFIAGQRSHRYFSLHIDN